MRPEREVLWASILHNSKHSRDPKNLKIIAIPACKKDFERILDCGENDSTFTTWFNKLVGIHAIELVCMIKKGQRGRVKCKGYIVNSGKLFHYLKSNPETKPIFNQMYKFLSKDRIL